MESIFPSFRSSVDDLEYYSKMKDYITSLAYVNYHDEWEMEQLDHKSNWFLVKDIPGVLNSVDLDKNFYTLCSLMEDNGASINPSKYTVIQFYSKLDYINNKHKSDDGSK